jgi:hypothetical protein
VASGVRLCERLPLARISGPDHTERPERIRLLREPFYEPLFSGKDTLQVIRHERTRSRRIQRGVGLDLGGVEVQLSALNQAGLKAHLYDPLEESPEDFQAVAFSDAS